MRCRIFGGWCDANGFVRSRALGSVRRGNDIEPTKKRREEFERTGTTRHEIYGQSVMDTLAERLKSSDIKGCSKRNLFKYQRFFLDPPEILPTVSAQSRGMPKLSTLLPILAMASLLNAFPLGWFHYVELQTVDSTVERRFYKIEAS